MFLPLDLLTSQFSWSRKSKKQKFDSTVEIFDKMKAQAPQCIINCEQSVDHGCHIKWTKWLTFGPKKRRRIGYLQLLRGIVCCTTWKWKRFTDNFSLENNLIQEILPQTNSKRLNEDTIFSARRMSRSRIMTILYVVYRPKTESGDRRQKVRSKIHLKCYTT